MVKIGDQWSYFRTMDAQTYSENADGYGLIGIYDDVEDIKLVDESEEECEHDMGTKKVEVPDGCIHISGDYCFKCGKSVLDMFNKPKQKIEKLNIYENVIATKVDEIIDYINKE